MKIGILGTGNIGATLTRKLSAAGHVVKVANSRGPDTINSDLLTTGAQAVTAVEAVRNVDVVILSVPLDQIPRLASVVADASSEAVVIDTSNYYPFRDGEIQAIEAGQTESAWVVEQLGRPIVKAWNAIGAASLAEKGSPAGAPSRVALPVAADRDEDRRVAMSLVEDTGLEAFDAGMLADSWRQQPGAPAYCTDLTRDDLRHALLAAKPQRLSKRRELCLAVMQDHWNDPDAGSGADWFSGLNRAINM